MVIIMLYSYIAMLIIIPANLINTSYIAMLIIMRLIVTSYIAMPLNKYRSKLNILDPVKICLQHGWYAYIIDYFKQLFQFFFHL